MNKEVAHILKNRLLAEGGLVFADVVSGMVETVTKRVRGENEQTLTIKMPVTHDINQVERCQVTPETAAVPNDSKNGLIYFEDAGAVITGAKGSRQLWRSSLVLVCWMNKAKFSEDVYSRITSAAVAEIMRKIGANTLANEGNFIGFSPKVLRVLPQTAEVFSKYSYDEAITQYLRPPFDFFAMQMVVDYGINPNCLDSIIKEGSTCY